MYNGGVGFNDLEKRLFLIFKCFINKRYIVKEDWGD